MRVVSGRIPDGPASIRVLPKDTDPANVEAVDDVALVEVGAGPGEETGGSMESDPRSIAPNHLSGLKQNYFKTVNPDRAQDSADTDG